MAIFFYFDKFILTFHCKLVKPSIWSAWCGHVPKRVHLYIRRYPRETIPSCEDEVAKWCIERWKEKDQLLESFYQKNQFTENCEPTKRQSPLFKLIISFISWIIFMAFLFYISFFISWWITLYVILVWSFYLVSSFSETLRVWRELDTPINDSSPNFLNLPLFRFSCPSSISLATTNVINKKFN